MEQVVEVIKQHSASAVVWAAPGGVIVIKMSGLLTAASVYDLRHQSHGRHRGQVGAVVVDYRRAVLALSGAEMDRVCIDDVGSAPAALVIQPAQLDVFLQHCLRVAQRGVMRRAFTELEPAAAWARAQAARRVRPGA